MKPRECETDLFVELPPTIWRHDHDVWRSKGVLCRQEDSTMVDPIFEFARGGPTKCVVPFKDVVLERCSRVLCAGIICQLASFAQDALDCRRLFVTGKEKPNMERSSSCQQEQLLHVSTERAHAYCDDVVAIAGRRGPACPGVVRGERSNANQSVHLYRTYGEDLEIERGTAACVRAQQTEHV